MAHPFEPLDPKRASAPPPDPAEPLLGTTRREFMKIFVLGGSSLVVGGTFLTREEARAQEFPDIFDVGDFIIASEEPYSAPPTSNLVLEVTTHNRVRFELPRLDKGQGIVTAIAMLIAEEMDADYDRTDVDLSDARADRPYSLTGYSCTVRAMWPWVRPLAAEARARLVTAAANRWGADPATLTVAKSLVSDPGTGRAASFGELALEAAALGAPAIPADPKPVSALTNLLGSSKPRKNARDIVTGKQKYTMDIDLPGAVYAVLARPANVKGTVASINNQAAVEAMPGVVGVVNIAPSANIPNGHALEGGVAVAATNLKQAFDARDALDITWNSGPLAASSDTEIRNTLIANNLPLTPVLPLFGSLDAFMDYPYVSHAPLEVQAGAAVYDVNTDTVEAWFSTQAGLYTKELIVDACGLSDADTEVTLHVPPCGGSFGRHLFSEAVVEASIVSKALGQAASQTIPVKVMWTRNDDTRNGRFRPMSRSALRASWDDTTGQMLSYEHHVSGAETDFKHGLGDAVSASGFDTGGVALNQSVFEGSVTVPYAFGNKEQRLTETFFDVPTCSWRSIYSGYTITSNEIFVDEIARETAPLSGFDEVSFRLNYLTSPEGLRAAACLNKVLEMAGVKPVGSAYTGPLPANMGVAIHTEYRSAVAHLVEIDASDPQDPRLVNAWIAVDVGIPLNPSGLSAQLQGALIDAWSVMFRAGNHVDYTPQPTDNTIREGSYGDFLWARMNHAPPTTEVYVFSATETGATEPGGCGELGLPPACAAVVNAYNRATGTTQHQFPILEFV